MLDALPLVFVLIGLVLYTVLAGADFGAGMWQLMSGPGERGERIRDHCHHAMGPVWEANHVWLIFVLTVTWTAYPVFFGSVASTLALAEASRVRALAAGAAAGGLALAGLIVVHADDHPLYTGLVHGVALAVLILSVVVGTTTMGLNATRRFELARYTAALAVALVVADWAFARWPTLLPGLRVDQAAAPHDTMVAVLVAVLAGAVLLFPALALLFTLTLRGQLGAHGEEAEPA